MVERNGTRADLCKSCSRRGLKPYSELVAGDSGGDVKFFETEVMAGAKGANYSFDTGRLCPWPRYLRKYKYQP